jgi:glycosyltransferase involved in cell wall biosynthesis
VNLLWCSNAPFVGSGYGVQTELFAPRLASLGHEVAFYANWGVQGACLDWKGFHVYPSDGEWGNRTLAACAAHFGDGIENTLVIALCDAWVLNKDRFLKGMKLAIWAPIDHEPAPPPSLNVLRHEAVTPLAMSEFGERMMRDAGLDPIYVPHGVDTEMFRPQPEIRGDVSEELGLPRDAFVVGMVAANQGSPQMHRKAFPQAFQAFARFRETHTDAVLYVHTNEMAQHNSGLHLRALAERCGIPRRSVVFTDIFAWEMGWPRQTLANAYNAFDVLLNPAMGEGFGVPILEAQACGVPVIVSDFSAMTELCGAGWLVEGDRWYDGPMDSFLISPSVESIGQALEQSYASGGLADQARRFALRYDVETVTEDYWQPALRKLTGATLELVA